METGGSIFLFHPLRPPQPQLPSPWRLLHAKPFSLSRKISCSSNNNSPRWDSNAESFQPRNFNFNAARNKPPQQDQEQDEFGKKRRWWSDDSPAGFQEESAGFWEEAIESLWILKTTDFHWILYGGYLLSNQAKSLHRGNHCID